MFHAGRNGSPHDKPIRNAEKAYGTQWLYTYHPNRTSTELIWSTSFLDFENRYNYFFEKKDEFTKSIVASLATWGVPEDGFDPVIHTYRHPAETLMGTMNEKNQYASLHKLTCKFFPGTKGFATKATKKNYLSGAP
jgi:hypothetical protein